MFKGKKASAYCARLVNPRATDNAAQHRNTTPIDAELLENGHIAHQNRYTALLRSISGLFFKTARPL
ncbi:MAG TPA: hypothetical protein DDZ82_04680 [Rhodobacteraceae bacterium]|nr:hypothetical protein [Paracoccaceae bacterium]HBM68103.1 hypothetical protein [Paracoccaceae bacterium]